MRRPSTEKYSLLTRLSKANCKFLTQSSESTTASSPKIANVALEFRQQENSTNR